MDLKMTVFESFCEAAKAVLTHEATYRLDGIIEKLDAIDGVWHPNGFAVFRLDDELDLGALRLHIWPKGKRVTRPDAPPIHSHVWHLCSFIMTGTYKETLFIETTGEAQTADDYNKASINYSQDQNSFHEAAPSNLKLTVTTIAGPGEYHTVPAGIPHETHIDEESFVATLLITSAPILAHAHVYGIDPILPHTYKRPKLSNHEKAALVAQLKELLATGKPTTTTAHP